MARRTGIGESRKRASPWVVDTKEVIYMAVGAALYGILSWATSGLKIPGPFDSQIRPGVSIPLFFGAAFGPVVGFFTGFVGNIIGDLLTGYGFSFNWSLGNGLMGMVTGLAAYFIRRMDNPGAIALAVAFSLLGIGVGMGFAAFTDIWADDLTLSEAVAQFVPIAATNAIAAIILVPVLGILYEATRPRTE